MTPRYVQHDGERWRVLGTDVVDDDEPAYALVKGQRQIWARVSECIPDDKPRVRRFKDDDYILEMRSRGEITIRQAGRRKRYVTSLAAIFSMTVKAAARLERDLKRIAKRKGKR